MSEYTNYYRIFRFMASGNFIKNRAQELHWKQQTGDPNHYYELAYKSNIDLEFLVKHGEARQKEIDMGGVLDNVSVLAISNRDMPPTVDDPAHATRIHLGFAVSGYIKHRLTEHDVRKLKLKDYAYFQELVCFEIKV